MITDDTPAARIARLDAALARHGQAAKVRRRIGTTNTFVEVDVRVRLTGYRADDMPAGIKVTDGKFIVSPTPLIAAGASWPGAAGGDVQIKIGDQLVVEGRVRAIAQVDNVVIGEWVRIEGRVSG
jgi:hypothetical protein